MTKKRVITQIAEVDKLLGKLFPDDWIASLLWTDEEKSRNSYFEGKDKISDAENKLFVLFPKTIMQGDHLMILSALSIYSICIDTPVEKYVNPRNNPQTQVKKDTNQFVIKKNN